jgi:apolipoprotein N-acyltransferase
MELPPYDPYNQPPAWWTRHTDKLAAAAVFVLTALLWVLAFPPFNVAELAYAFAAPALFWAYRSPSVRLYAFTVLAGSIVAWTIILGWIHHVSWLAFCLLGPTVGLWVGSWFLAARWVLPRLPGRGILERIIAVFGLAALWVLIEWTRSWFLTGFPWLPLASSQWKRVSILQISAFTGAYGVSFVLIAMNIGFAAYAHRLLMEGRKGLQRRSQEFFACLFLLVICVTVHVQEVLNWGRFTIPFGRIAIVQPNIPQTLKWDPSQAQKIYNILDQSTQRAARSKPDLILWPEACSPLSVKGDQGARDWTEGLVSSCKVPLLLGSDIIEPTASGERWYNGALLVDPVTGLQDGYYAKQHLVPFGEYVPLRPLLGWLDKIVPVGGDFNAGSSPQPFSIKLNNRQVPVGTLICFEDCFPQLTRMTALAGSEVLVVLTNNAWFGESAAAEQHATHSVLRAVETRRPVIRCGNNGWSGWIDEYGNIRHRIANEEGRIFIRANTTVSLTRDTRWIGNQSFYVRHGDWFLLLCAALAITGFLMVRRPLPAPKAE